jgi:hypothetical protein
MKITCIILLCFISLQLRAQLFIDAEGSLGLNQEKFGSIGFGKRFKNGLSLRGTLSYGNFGKETGDAAPPYSFLILTQDDFVRVVGFSSSHTGGALGLGLGYTFQLNEMHGIYVEALGQVYRVTDDLRVSYRYSGGPRSGEGWTRKQPESHNSWSAGLGVSHQIRINHFLTAYYGIRANYFAVLLEDMYEPNDGNVMCGVEPTIHAGLRFFLVKGGKE